MDQLLVTVALNSLHQGIHLLLLNGHELFVLFLNLPINLLLMILDLGNLQRICLISKLVSLAVFFLGEVLALHPAQVADLFRKYEVVVTAQVLVTNVQPLKIVLFTQSSEALVCRLLVVLHVDVPSGGELNKLNPLHLLDLPELSALPLLHLRQLSPHLNLGDLLELVVGDFRLSQIVVRR